MLEADSTVVDLGGTWLALPADDDLRRITTGAEAADGEGLADDAWEPVRVPAHWRSHAAFASNDDPLLYRTRFSSPRPSAAGPGPQPSARPSARRHWLVMHGVFYQSDVWLDGTYLGDTEGYYVPHRFEVSAQMTERTEHSLVVDVACPPQRSRRAKRSLTGVFQHWDCIDPDWNPGGIWRPVELRTTGPVAIERMRVLCPEATTARATVTLRAVLDADDATEVEVVTRIGGHEHHFSQPLSGGQNRVEWQVTVTRPELWWPHALGAANLSDVSVTVLDHAGERSDGWTGRIGLRSVRSKNMIFSVNGERLFLKGANLGPTRMALAEATSDELRADIQRAKDLGLDLVRLHAHISRPEMYEAADELGMMIWQDLPLQWGYARSVRREAVRQAREAVDLLGHHPSIAVWCGHNEPLAMDVEPGRKAADMAATYVALQFLPTWNKNVLDFAIAQTLRRSDRSRPVIPYSGVLPGPFAKSSDSHFYFGWYHHDERDLTQWLHRVPNFARFLSEFGAQAVPSTADFCEPERWPDLDWERLEMRHSLQRRYLDARIGTAENYLSLANWRDASQAYQGQVVGHHITQLRRLKYHPAGGFAMFSLADAMDHPAITWALFGHDRAPKDAADIVRRACAVVVAVADRLPARVHPGDEITLDLHVVNDGREAVHGLEVGLRAEDQDGLPVAITEWGWAGDVPADAVVRAGSAHLRVPATAVAITVTPWLRRRDGSTSDGVSDHVHLA